MAVQITDAPFGNVATVFTHKDVYTRPREIVNRFFIATFAAPSALMSVVLPVIAHDEEDMEWTEYYADLHPLGPHSSQAGHETFFNRSKRQRFSMRWYGLSFMIDGSLEKTSARDYMVSQNLSILRSDVYLTIMIQIMDVLLKVKDMYALYKETLTVKNYHRMTDAQAEINMMALKETLPGFLDKQGSHTRAVADSRSHQDAWIASFMEYADTILATHRVQADLVANFMILSTPTARSIQTTQIAEFTAPDETTQSVNNFMRKSTGDNDLLLSLRPVSLRQFQGVNIIPLAPYNTDEGVTNVMEEIHTFGLFHFLHLPTWAQTGNFEWWRTSASFSIPDFEKRNDRMFHIKNPTFASESTFRGTTADTSVQIDANRINPFVKFRIDMEAAFIEFFGTNENYDKSAIRFLFYTSMLRFLPYVNSMQHCVLHMNGVTFMNSLLAYYGQFYHMLDKWTPTRKRETDKYHVFTRITSLPEFKQRYHLFMSTLTRSGQRNGANQVASDSSTITAVGAHSVRVRTYMAGFRAQHFFSMDNQVDNNRNVANAWNTPHPAPTVCGNNMQDRILDVNQIGRISLASYTRIMAELQTWPEHFKASGVNTCNEAAHNVMSSAAGCSFDPNSAANWSTMNTCPLTDASAFQLLLDVLFLVDRKESTPIFVPSVPVTVRTRYSYEVESAVDVQNDLLNLKEQQPGAQGSIQLQASITALYGRALGETGALGVNPLADEFLRSLNSQSRNGRVVPSPQDITCNLPVMANYANILVVRPKIHLATESILYGIGGKVTGVTALGQERYEEAKRYTEQDEQFRVKMRMAVCLAHPEHIIRMESAKYRRYIEGGTADVFTNKDFESNASSQFSTPQRKRVATHASKDVILMALPKFSGSSTTNMTNNTKVQVNASDVGHYMTFRDINTSVLAGKHVGTPFMLDLVSYHNTNTNVRNIANTECCSYILVGNGLIRSSVGQPCATQVDIRQFIDRSFLAARDCEWTVKVAPDAKPAKTDVLCWENLMSKADITNKYRPTADELIFGKIFINLATQVNDGGVNAAAAAVVMDHSIDQDNAELHAHITEHVSRGPFRFLTSKTAVDVWNGRSMQSAA